MFSGVFFVFLLLFVRFCVEAKIVCYLETKQIGTMECSPLGVQFNSLLEPLEEMDGNGRKNVNSLSLHDANIVTLSGFAFTDAETIRELDLSKNLLWDLTDSPFSLLSNLRNLNLSGNSMSSIGPDVLQGLVELRELDLSHNSLQINKEVQQLLNLPKLRILDVTNNILVDITDLKLPPTLKSLIASDTIVLLNRDSFSEVNQLTNLDLSIANLNSVPSKMLDKCPYLVSLDLSSNSIGTPGLPSDLFTRLTSLKTINLSRNFLMSLNNPVLFSKNKELVYLDLSHNMVSSVTPRLLANNVNLVVLILSNNRLKKLHPEVLGGLKSLEYLDLSNNVIESLDNEFYGLVSLDWLSLSGNALKSLRVNAFSYTKLRILDLSRNLLARFDSQIILNLNSLLTLNLHRNHLTSVDTYLLRDSSLNQLSLSCNNLTVLPSSFFDRLEVHKTVFLAGNPWICGCLNRDLDDLAFVTPVGRVPFDPDSFVDGRAPTCLVGSSRSCTGSQLSRKDAEVWERALKKYPHVCGESI